MKIKLNKQYYSEIKEKIAKYIEGKYGVVLYRFSLKESGDINLNIVFDRSKIVGLKEVETFKGNIADKWFHELTEPKSIAYAAENEESDIVDFVLNGKYYSITKQNLSGLSSFIKETYKNHKDRYENLAYYFADSPVDFEIDLEKDIYTLTYNPVSHWYGDEYRGDDNIRSSVEASKTKTITKTMDWVITPFNSIIEEYLIKHSKELGEVIKTDLDLTDEDISAFNQIKQEYKQKMVDEAMDKHIKTLSQEPMTIGVLDAAYAIQKISQSKYQEIVPQKVKDIIENNKALLIDEDGENCITRAKNIFGYSNSSVILEVLNSNIDTFYSKIKNFLIIKQEEPDIFNRHNLKQVIINKLGLDKNVFVKEESIPVPIEKLKEAGLIIDYKVEAFNTRKGTEYIAAIKVTDEVVYKNDSGFPNGVIIGKGGRNIKEFTKRLGKIILT